MSTAAQKSPRAGQTPFKLPALQLAANDGGKLDVPDWVMMFPAGHTYTNDGRLYKNDNPEAVIAETERAGVYLPADIAHGMEYGSTEAAMGWVEKMEVRDGAIWGRVDWTDLGRQKILAKHYRYISPAFNVDADHNLLEFTSIALVNQPALSMPALANSEKTAGELAAKTQQNTETSMDEETLAKFRKIFGLDEDADEAAVEAAINKAAAAVDQAEEDEPGTSEEDADAEEEEVTLPENPDPENFVHRADYDAVVDQLAQSAATQADAPTETEIDAAIAEAVTAGRIAPATKDHHKAMCSTRKGFDNFKSMVKISPKIVPDRSAKKQLASKDLGGDGLTDNQRKTCAAMGLDPKAYAANRKITN